MTSDEQKFGLISLFSGAGGLDLGLESAGFQTLLATDNNTNACETLRRNKELQKLSGAELEEYIEKLLTLKCFKTKNISDWRLFFNRLRKIGEKRDFLEDAAVVSCDVRALTLEKIKTEIKDRPVFCVAGGPPCQPFSKAGKKLAVDDIKNGSLFMEFVRIVDGIKPKWFVFENVKGLTFTKTDVIYVECAKCKQNTIAPFSVRGDFKDGISPKNCSNCGSKNTKFNVQSERGGSLKIILAEFDRIGYTCHHKILNSADFGVPQLRERLFIVGSLDGKNYSWPEPKFKKVADGNGQETLFDVGLPERLTMSNFLSDDLKQELGCEWQKNLVLWVKNVVRPHDEPVTWTLDRPSPTIGAHQAAKLAFAPSGVPEKQIYRQQWATKGRRQGDTPPVEVNHRYLTDEELLVLQSFPRWWFLYGTRMERAFQIGNAVPPLLASEVGRSIIESESNGK